MKKVTLIKNFKYIYLNFLLLYNMKKKSKLVRSNCCFNTITILFIRKKIFYIHKNTENILDQKKKKK